MGYIYIFGCILFTVYGQLVLKWRMNEVEGVPTEGIDKIFFMVKLILTDPFVFSGFFSAFIASLFWMNAMTKFSISYAYPFMSLSFVIVMFGAYLLLGESITLYKAIGTIVVVSGLIILSQG